MSQDRCRNWLWERGDGTVRDDDEALRRVRFFSPEDMSAGRFVWRVVELVEQFDERQVPLSLVEVIELHNVLQFLVNDMFPNEYTVEQRERATARIPKIRGAVARYFSEVDESNFASRIAGVELDGREDLLELLSQAKVFERCSAAVALPALTAAGFHLPQLLGCKKLVMTYDSEVRDLLLESPRGAEFVVEKHLLTQGSAAVHLPQSLTKANSRELLERYIDSEDANPNYVGLIATAKDNSKVGVDAKLKLRAKRRSDAMTADFFEQNTGFKTGYEIGLSGSQVEPVVFEIDDSDDAAGLVSRYTYSSTWLEETSDFPSVLKNFQHLFEFVDDEGLLAFPSYPAYHGLVDRVFKTHGKDDYVVGAAFNAIDTSSLLQTRLYLYFLESKGIALEAVISWFFETYLVEEFGVTNFSFTPSGDGTTYLQKVRHVFAEMESVVKQFTLFVENGELDRDLLPFSSELVRYKTVPSLLEGKYVYPVAGSELEGVLFALFSDQSGLTYIREGLQGDNAARLLLENEVAYADFADYQKRSVDRLIELGILEDTGGRVRVCGAIQFRVLHALFSTQAAAYFHLPPNGRVLVDEWVEKGWVTRSGSLLSEAEGKYFNYFLNNAEFSNGPALRNKYVHGSQRNDAGEDTHFHAYVTALRMVIALVLKMNDEFCLRAQESDRPVGSD
ncbi:MAG: hypothetical protein WA912_06525 [Ornithinimicrobium sp.]